MEYIQNIVKLKSYDYVSGDCDYKYVCNACEDEQKLYTYSIEKEWIIHTNTKPIKPYTLRQKMAIEVYSDKVELKVSAKRLWKAAFEDAHSILPKASHDVVERVEYEGASFEVGSIRTIHFVKSMLFIHNLHFFSFSHHQL